MKSKIENGKKKYNINMENVIKVYNKKMRYNRKNIKIII